ncbi:MAG: hypothetical protein WBN66_02425 [Smithella sp.]
MKISLLAIGLISILGQVVLLRELNVSFYGVELIYLLALGVWLFWTALGAIIGRRVHTPSLRQIAALFIFFGIVIPLDIVFIRSSRLLLGGLPGAYLDFFQQIMVALIALLPAGLLSGLLFQWAAKAYVAKNETLAVAYAIESAGGLMGGLFSTLFVMWELQNFTSALLCALISVIISLMILKDIKASRWRATALLLSCLLFGLLWISSSLDNKFTQWNHPRLLESRDTPYGRVTVTKLYNQISVYENDALSFETEGTDAEYFCHLTALQHPHPQKVLILGGGIEGLVREVAKYSPQTIDYVELNPALLQMVTKHLPEDMRKSMEEPNVNIIFADPRQYLNKSPQYDLILVGMPEPSSGQANRFFTREFFEQCSAKLNPGGILGFRLRASENLWTKPLANRNAGIFNAVRSVYSSVLFLPGTTNIVTASRSPLPQTHQVMIQRLQKKQIATRLITPGYIQYIFTNDRFFEVRDLLHNNDSPLNTDIQPVCYQYAFIIWLSKFFPRLGLFDLSLITNNLLLKPPLLFLWIGLPVFFLLSRFHATLQRALLVGAAGFIGMVMETILILYYQLKQGVLYQDIGVLLMSFMAGLALGALIVKKAMSRPVHNQSILRGHGVILIIGFCLLCAFTETNLLKSDSAGLPQISLLLAVTGFLVAGIFAYASLYEIDDQQKVISPLYAADLIGGCIGSLLGSLFLIPLMGMDATTWAMLVFAAASLLLV